ncbi:MAG: Sir2 family NAD-dependent protein deacetylase, partial [Candidatus Omnitrophica bacterium]|nr:Sir2 family NAD-dependent protein deacetylase [Candidatus Omnitrophota bacterium]
DFARDFIHLEESLKPTFTHTFLAQLENSGKLRGVITQNIDSLHQRAGSQNVFEVHGSFWRSHCLKCKREYSYEHLKEVLQEQDVPFCFCNGVIKPDVVFFGESVKYMQEAAELAASVDLFFVLGTSCTVFPAASLPEYASGRIIVINNTPVRLNCYNIALEVIEDTDSFFQRVHNFLESE